MLKLIIGNRNYSSWSLRAWLYLRESGIEFEEHRIPLFTESWVSEIAALSPAGRVPILFDGSIRVWDSLAIIEYCLDGFPGAVGWPTDPGARAQARSIVAEMHSGFLALRDELPQNIRRHRARPIKELSRNCRKQLDRIVHIWSSCRNDHGAQGPWLYGKFSIADVMFAPVALRFATYSIDVDHPADEYIEAIQSLDSIREWCRAAADEVETLDFIDNLVPAADSDLTLG